MSSRDEETICVQFVPSEDLADMLRRGADTASWSYRAAVDLLVAQGSWLEHWEFRQAVDAFWMDDSRPAAWVDWRMVDQNGPASSGETAILELACGLGGVPSVRPLSDQVFSLDAANSARLLRAIAIASTGREDVMAVLAAGAGRVDL